MDGVGFAVDVPHAHTRIARALMRVRGSIHQTLNHILLCYRCICYLLNLFGREGVTHVVKEKPEY